MSGARLVLPSMATKTEWLAARRQGVTASEIAVIMGLSSFSSPYALYWQKRGDLPRQDDSVAMALGRHLESFVVEMFRERRPELVVGNRDGRYLFAHPDRPWQMATPDGLIRKIGMGLDPLAVLEAKTAASYDDWGDDGSDEIPVAYRCQVLWQLDVLSVTTGYVACLFLHSRKLRVYELTLDGAARIDLKVMRNEAREFLDRIDLGDPPEVDWRPATGEALRRLHPSVVDKDMPIGPALRIQYQAAVRRFDEAKQRKALLTNRVLDAIGDGRRAVAAGPGGEVIATRSASEPKRVNADQLRAEYPAAAAACTHGPEHPEIKLTPAKPPKEKP